MSGPGAITVAASGSITAPATIAATVSAALTSLLFSRVGQIDVVSFPSMRAIAVCNGYDFQQHFFDGAQYLTGPIAPYTAPTVASTAVQATAVFTFTAATRPNNADQFSVLGANGVLYYVSFMTTLSTSLGIGYIEIARGADLAATIANITKFFNGTGTNGTEYYLNWPGFGTDDAAWRTAVGIQQSASTATTETLRAVASGAGGNSYQLNEVIDGGASWAVTTFAGAATGTISGDGPLQGHYGWAFARVRKADGAQTGLSATATLDTTSLSDVTASSLEAAPTRDGMDLYRLFRTLADGDEFHKVKDSSSSPITDSKSDTVIDADLNLIDDANTERPYSAGYPVRYRFHAMHLGCLFGAGAYPSAKLSEVAAAVTNGSRTVVFANLKVKEIAIGRTLRVLVDDRRYRIAEVVEATKTVTLSEPYEGATSGATDVEIVDDRDPNRIRHTEPLLINNWPEGNELTGVSSADPRGVTGMRSIDGTLGVWTRTGTWRVLGTPDTGFRVVSQREATGAYCNRAIVDCGQGIGLVWLGPDGVHRWTGTGDPSSLSKPFAGEEPTGIEATLQRINPLAVDGIVANYNPSMKVVRWAVPVDGSTWNNLLVQLNLQTGAFTFGYCDAITSMESVLSPSGTYVTLAGDQYSQLWQLDNGYSDGAYAFECVQTLSSYDATLNKATVSGTPFPTASGGLAGVPVYQVKADGSIQRNTVAANTSSTLTFVGPWETFSDGAFVAGASPAAATQLVVGGIFWRLRSTKFSLGIPEIRKTLSSLTFHFKTSTAGQVWCAASVDNGDPAIFTLLDGTLDYADLTAAKGTKYFELRRGPGRTVQLDLFALAPGFDLTCVALAATFRSREYVPR